MPLLRTVECDICRSSYTEEGYGAGFPGWMNILGIELDGNSQIWLCPTHMGKVADFIDEEKHGKIEMVEK